VPTYENLAVKIAQNFPYEYFICKVLKLYVIKKEEKLLIVYVKEGKYQVVFQVWRKLNPELVTSL
jgi:hypothetical protein